MIKMCARTEIIPVGSGLLSIISIITYTQPPVNREQVILQQRRLLYEMCARTEIIPISSRSIILTTHRSPVNKSFYIGATALQNIAICDTLVVLFWIRSLVG